MCIFKAVSCTYIHIYMYVKHTHICIHMCTYLYKHMYIYTSHIHVCVYTMYRSAAITSPHSRAAVNTSGRLIAHGSPYYTLRWLLENYDIQSHMWKPRSCALPYRPVQCIACGSDVFSLLAPGRLECSGLLTNKRRTQTKSLEIIKDLTNKRRKQTKNLEISRT